MTAWLLAIHRLSANPLRVLAALLAAGLLSAQASEITYKANPVAMAFAAEWAAANSQPVESVQAIIGEAKRLDRVIKYVTPAPTGFQKDWRTYRSRFVEPKRIKAGVAFWKAHQKILKETAAATGIPAWLIVGVIGVETIYGQQTGRFSTLDALSTLAFDFPESHPKAAARAAFFRDELGHFLQLATAQQTPIDSWQGSYAGALGLPQFMPSSWVKYAVDGDQDGRIDLRGSTHDAIASVANYFVAFGWRSGMPTHYPVKVRAKDKALDDLLAPDIVPTFEPSDFHQRGARLGKAGQRHNGKLALVKLENAGKRAELYLAGTDNFYVITRYNWSSYYALAVIELGKAVEQAVSNKSPKR